MPYDLRQTKTAKSFLVTHISLLDIEENQMKIISLTQEAVVGVQKGADNKAAPVPSSNDLMKTAMAKSQVTNLTDPNNTSNNSIVIEMAIFHKAKNLKALHLDAKLLYCKENLS